MINYSRAGIRCRRSLEKFSATHLAVAQSVDPDMDAGELIITIPQDALETHINVDKFFDISIEYSIEEPCGGIHFVIPECEGSLAEVR